MNNIEFLEYIATPDEKHLGIASIKYLGLILRYKIFKSDKGGLFTQSASFKSKDPYTGEDKWLKSIVIDSTTENDRVNGFITHHAKMAINKTSARSDIPKDINTENLPF